MHNKQTNKQTNKPRLNVWFEINVHVKQSIFLVWPVGRVQLLSRSSVFLRSTHLCTNKYFSIFILYCQTDIKWVTLAEEFGTSSKRNECERDCPEPCEYEEYKTSFSYSGLQKDVLVEHLMSLLNNTEKSSVDRAIYEPLLNMTRAEREKYIE